MKQKFYLYIILLLIFSLSCEKEKTAMSPCSESMPGLICKEYRYTVDDFLGTVEYFYNSKRQLVREDRFSSDHNSRHIYYEYMETGLIINRKEFDQDEKLREFHEYFYNEFDSLSVSSQKVDGLVSSISVFEYDQDRNLIRKKTESADGDTQFIEYVYDNGKLFKESHSNKFHQLTYYILFDHYSNFITRLRYYNNQNMLTRSIVYIRDNKGRMLEKKSYYSDSHLYQREFWTYNQNLLIKYARNNGDNFPLDYTLYQY